WFQIAVENATFVGVGKPIGYPSDQPEHGRDVTQASEPLNLLVRWIDRKRFGFSGGILHRGVVHERMAVSSGVALGSPQPRTTTFADKQSADQTSAGSGHLGLTL